MIYLRNHITASVRNLYFFLELFFLVIQNVPLHPCPTIIVYAASTGISFEKVFVYKYILYPCFPFSFYNNILNRWIFLKYTKHHLLHFFYQSCAKVKTKNAGNTSKVFKVFRLVQSPKKIGILLHVRKIVAS